MDLSAKFVHEAGCRLMRGGRVQAAHQSICVPRARVEGLDMFRKAAEKFKLPIVTS